MLAIDAERRSKVSIAPCQKLISATFGGETLSGFDVKLTGDLYNDKGDILMSCP